MSDYDPTLPISHYGASKFEIIRDGRSVAIFHRYEDARAFLALEAERDRLRAATAALMLESMHYLDSSRGADFLRGAIETARAALAETEVQP